MTKEMHDRAIKRRCVKLAHDECANYVRGRCVDPDRIGKGDYDCDCVNHYIITEGGIECDFFLLCVQPQDKELEKAVWAEIYKPIEDEGETKQREAKPCALCGKQFVPRSNRQKYCRECRYKADKKNRAKRARERRMSGKA